MNWITEIVDQNRTSSFIWVYERVKTHHLAEIVDMEKEKEIVHEENRKESKGRCRSVWLMDRFRVERIERRRSDRNI